MIFKPFPCKSRWEGLLVTSWIVLVDSLLIVWMTQRSVDAVSFLLLLGVLISVPLFVHLAYRTWGAFNLVYWLDRDALHVRWAATHQIVPLTAIRCVVRGRDGAGKWNLLNWPSPYVRLEKGRQGPVASFATRPLSECLLLETDEATFALSPMHSEAFLEALQSYNQLGPLHVHAIERRHPFRGGGSILDGTGRWLVMLGALGALFLLGTLMVQYPALPERLVFHYNSTGAPNSIRPKSALFLLPIIGLVAFVFNGVAGMWMAYRGQRVGAYLLWGGTLTVQLLVLLALASIIA